MATDIQDALLSLERARDGKLAEAKQIEEAIRQLKGALILVPEGLELPGSKEYAGMGASEAAREFIKAVGKPMTTREMVDGMIERGWRTRSKNTTATLHATLANSKEWKRNTSGEWAYVGHR